MSEDLRVILDLMTGSEDGGSGFVFLRSFLSLCEKQGTPTPFVAEFAKLCRACRPGGFVREQMESAK